MTDFSKQSSETFSMKLLSRDPSCRLFIRINNARFFLDCESDVIVLVSDDVSHF